MRFRTFNLVVVAFMIATTNVVGEASYQILLPGEWPGEDISVAGGPDWWGIFPDGDGFTLQTSPVVISDRKGPVPGITVAIPQESKPVLLIQGLKDPVEGPILAATLEPLDWLSAQSTPLRQNAFLFPGQSHRLTLPTDKTRLTAVGIVEEDPEFHHASLVNYQIRMYRGEAEKAVSQVLTTIPRMGDLGEPYLVWAGDIDRDGKIDLIYDLTDHYIKTHLALFLSSAAKEGELVGLVAEWKWSSC